jgi:hypothetical protein
MTFGEKILFGMVALATIKLALAGYRRMSFEAARVARWHSKARGSFSVARRFKPLSVALEHRETIKLLVNRGHGKVAKSVMREVDQIIATIEATQDAMERHGITVDNPYGPGWIENPKAVVTALAVDARRANLKLQGIILKVRTIAEEGTRVSASTAGLSLQMTQSDFEAESSAMTETARELEIRPL